MGAPEPSLDPPAAAAAPAAEFEGTPVLEPVLAAAAAAAAVGEDAAAVAVAAADWEVADAADAAAAAAAAVAAVAVEVAGDDEAADDEAACAGAPSVCSACSVMVVQPRLKERTVESFSRALPTRTVSLQMRLVVCVHGPSHTEARKASTASAWSPGCMQLHSRKGS